MAVAARADKVEEAVVAPAAQVAVAVAVAAAVVRGVVASAW